MEIASDQSPMIMSISDFQIIGVAISCQLNVHVRDVENDLFPVSGGNSPLAKSLVTGIGFRIVRRVNVTFGILQRK